MPLRLIKRAGLLEIFDLRSKGKTQSNDASFCAETLSLGFEVAIAVECQSGTNTDSRTGIFCDGSSCGNNRRRYHGASKVQAFDIFVELTWNRHQDSGGRQYPLWPIGHRRGFFDSRRDPWRRCAWRAERPSARPSYDARRLFVPNGRSPARLL